MPRELNKDLFANTPTGVTEASQGGSSASEALIQELVVEISRLKRQIKELENKSESTSHRLNELARGTKAGLERLQAGQQRLEQAVKAALQDVKTKVSTFAGRLTERKVSDLKIEELVDRHNQVVMNFEQRLNQLQKIISEQEMKLMAYQSAMKQPPQVRY